MLQKQAGEKPASASYRRDPLGRTTEETITYGEGVEAIRRTQSAHQPGVWGYDPDHRLTQYGEGATLTALDSSPNGQRSERITPNHRTRYHYDAADRLTSLERDAQEQARYQYDPFGRRISKTVAGITTWYLYTDEGLIAELDETGSLRRAYGWEPDSAYGTKPLWQAEIQGASWQFHFLHPDHLGTPQLATDAQGNISWQAQSEAFGRTFPAPSNAITMNLRFPGQYFDQELGLHYNYFRDYDPEVGRYVERDPMGLAGGVNLYGYVEGNPIGAIDPQGLLVIDKKACKKRQREQIEDAERKVEKAIGKICDQCKNENGCVPCRFRKRLLNNLATTIVSCERGEKCGRTDEANTKITIISPNGFNPNSYCGEGVNSTV